MLMNLLSRSLMALALALSILADAQAATPAVVVSIKPIHSLVAAVMKGVAEPVLLVDAGQSPHTYSLRPSNARALAGADLLIWIGPGLEAFLAKPIGTLGGGAQVLELSQAPGLEWLAQREGGVLGPTEREPAAHAHADAPAEHRHGNGEDMHIWLDPRNAIAMVDAIARALEQVDPDHAPGYRRNAREVRDSLLALDAETASRLAPLRGTGYLVFHDGYQYFEHRYGLHALGAITINPGLMPGAQRLRAIRERVRAAGRVCVFAEPQFEPRLVRSLVEGTGARADVLDPLGAALAAGPGLYPALIRAMTDAFVSCLGAQARAPAQPGQKSSATR